ncbi:MAG TPA: hypothetical protein VH763_05020 [Gemmatimonadales bacterium]|jgi:hypothetical protein
MYPKPIVYALATCTLTVVLAAGTASPSRFEAHTTGAKELTLGGSAEFGPVRGTDGAGPFVLTLGAQSATGAVLFTAADDIQPGPGVYRLSTDPSRGIHALVLTGSPDRPTGVFRARGGELTITGSRGDRIEGSFQLDAIGFEAANPNDETRELSVHGTFRALFSGARK